MNTKTQTCYQTANTSSSSLSITNINYTNTNIVQNIMNTQTQTFHQTTNTLFSSQITITNKVKNILNT